MKDIRLTAPFVVALGLGLTASAENSEDVSKEVVKPASALVKKLEFAEGKTISIPGQKAAEGGAFVDIDGDGKLDFVSGNYGGNLIVRKNTADAGAIKLAEPTMLKRGEKTIKLTHW